MTINDKAKAASKKPFATQAEIEELAANVIKAYIKDCHCKGQADILHALQKVIAVSIDMRCKVEYGKMERVLLN